MRRNSKNRILLGIIIVFALIFTGAVGYLIYGMIVKWNSENTYNNMASSYAAHVDEYYTENDTADYTGHLTSPNGTTVPEQVEHTVDQHADDNNGPVSFEGLRGQNKDIYAWIYVPGTNINYPVLQSAEDDNFYLHHDVYKNYSFPGAIYTQAYNSKDWSDRVTVLYGHNMASGAMFAHLHRFSDKSFFDSHPYIYIYTEDSRRTYKIVSSHSYDDLHILNAFDFTKDDVFQAWIEQAKNPHSLYCNVRKDVDLNLDSKMIVLSTCLNSGSGRYLVEGVLIDNEQTE